jgi:hypothetical protein
VQKILRIDTEYHRINSLEKKKCSSAAKLNLEKTGEMAEISHFID